jgi:glycerol-3-phosphate acyltransferase PlsY
VNGTIAVLAAVAGYLLGSISSARLVVRLRTGGSLAEIEYAVPNTADVFQSSSASATAVRFQMGARYGCLIAVLDALKAVVPALALKLWQPQAPYFLIAATAAVIGHNYPLYYRFKGGRGLAAIYGGLFVLDWAGVLITSLAGMGIGILLGQVLLIRWAGLVLMIPWTWFRTHDALRVAYVILMNALFFFAMRRELRQYFRLKREGKLPDPQAVAEFMGMGSMYRIARRFSLARLFSRRGTASD